MSEVFILFYKGNILGVFNDKECLNNQISNGKEIELFNEDDIKIINYKVNTILSKNNNEKIPENIKQENTKQPKKHIIIKKEHIPEVKNDKPKLSQEEFDKIAQEKIDITHSINLLKMEKKKLEEEENVYNTDIKLFNMFKNHKLNNDDFQIPELFEPKYYIMKELEDKNELNFKNFKVEWDKVKPKNNYNMFGENDYEKKFETVNNIEETFNI